MNAHYRSFAALRGAPRPVDIARIDFGAIDHEARILRAHAVRDLLHGAARALRRLAAPAGSRVPARA
jgi:hypothetical protein